jgi:hypothetical protein
MNNEQLNQLIKQVAQDAAREAIAEYRAQNEHPQYDRARAESFSPPVAEAYANFFNQPAPKPRRLQPIELDAIRAKALSYSPEMAEAFCNLHGQHSPHPTIPSPPSPKLRPFMEQLQATQGTISEDSIGGPLRRSPAFKNLPALGK